jgi:hypothetical protein
MPGLKRHLPDIRFSGNKVSPDEIDMYQTYNILHPSVSASALGTVNGTAGSGGIAPVVSELDYPRNVLYSITGSDLGGTLVVNGQNQFGGTQTETLSVAAAAGGGTVAGTKVFATLGTMTFTKDGEAGTQVVGYAIAAEEAKFGLPNKVGGTGDIKRAVWIDADVTKVMTREGTASPAVVLDTVNHGVTVNVSGGIAAADSFVVTYVPSYNSENEANNAGL